MSTDPTSILAAALVGAGLAADLAVLRVFAAERRGTPRPRGRLRRRAGMAVAATFAGPTLAAADDGLTTRAAITLRPPASEPLTISTDRPSFSDGTGIMPTGHLNLETGYTFTYRDRDGVETQRHNGPEVLLRAGVLDDRLEVRLMTSGYILARSDAGSGFETDGGWSDATVGVKVKLCDQDGGLPRLAVGLQSTVGAGSDEASSQTPEPTFKLLWSYDLGAASDRWKGWTIGGNLNAAWTTTAGDRYLQGQASIYASFPLTPTLSGFAEYFVLGPASKGGDAAHSIDLGATWLATPKVQLDARVGFGLNQEADNVFGGVGVSFLF